MTAISWPINPTTGQVYTANGVSWKWDGTSWNRQGGSIAAEITEGALALVGTQAQAEEATAADRLASLQNIRQHVGIESTEKTWIGFRTTTDTTPAAGTWSMTAAASPFVRTYKYRPHTLAEHDEIMHRAVGGAYIQQFQSSTIFRQYYAPSITSAAVAGSDIPLITALAYVEFGTGTFAANTDSLLSILGAVRSLSARTHAFKDTKGNNQVTMDQTYRNFPRRAGTTEYSEDWEMEVYATSMTSVINTRMAGVTGWNASSATAKVGHARVQWSTNNGQTWLNSPEFTDVYVSDITANLPVAAGYQIRPANIGPVKIRWQVRRGNAVEWWFDRSQAFASVA